MAEHALTGIATAAAKVLVQSVATRALDEIKLNWSFNDNLQKLHRKFQYIQAFLEDASNSKYGSNNQQVDLWVQKVMDAAYLADNLMDEYAIEIFRRNMEVKNPVDMFCNFFTPYNPLLFHFRMAHQVMEILSLFDEIDKECKNIGLNRVDIAVTSVTHTYNYDHNLSQTRQYPPTSASEFVGRVKDESKLLDFICRPVNYEEPLLSTVAIVGMGGMGKTTLARHLYDHERVCDHFGKKIWICVSENFDVTRLLNEMVESVTSSKSTLSNMDAITRKLQENLNGHKVLFVLDDVWNDNENLWGSLKGLLHRIGIAQGGVILTTTRSDEVAKAAGAVFKLKLEGLSDDESWSLFHQIVFKVPSPPCLSNLEEIGRRIVVEKCKGVPLAIKVIGGLLKSEHDNNKWQTIETSEIWELNQDKHQILPSLLLSYNHLPYPSLKQCFAYFGLLHKHYYMYKSELIGFWSSQGYLRDDKRKNLTMEKIGEEYLNILLSNSLLEEYVPKGLENVCYKMHDLVFDLAVYVCGSDLILKAEKLVKNDRCRHLLFNFRENKISPDFPPEKALTKLRTIFFKGCTPWNLLTHSRNLRTLILYNNGIIEVPEVISLLKHLRYLDVSYNPISTLPDSICKLYQLETLILQGCINMKKLPKVVNKLVNMRHISTTTPMSAWNGLQKLTNLRSLPCLHLEDDEDGCTIDELGDLHQLRDEIHVQGLECVKHKEQAKKADLAGKTNVFKLTLSWAELRENTSEGGGGICDEDILEGLEPHPNITLLEVQNFMGLRFPTWITGMAVLTRGPSGDRTKLNNLTKVKLLNCSRCETLPKLGQLPSLKCLILSGLCVECIGVEFYGGDGLDMPEVISFQCLRELEISRFSRLAAWMQPLTAAFPRLESLRITDCSLLKSVPALEVKSLTSLELKNLNSVESLDIIKYCLGLTSFIMDTLPKIASLPEELANCRKLQILNIDTCHTLARMPTGLESLVNLKSMSIQNCSVINFVMGDLHRVRSSLGVFLIGGCPRLTKIPSGLEECTLLEALTILKCPMIEKGSLTDIRKLRRLRDFSISCSSAEHLKSVLKAAKDLPLLRTLVIDGYRDEKDMTDYFSDSTLFGSLPSLRNLVLCGCPNIKTLPPKLGLLTQIAHLYFLRFEDLEEIPPWICKLCSLTDLILFLCKNLKYLPSKEHLKRLVYLEISQCPLLVERYAKDKGSEWHNISHIRKIQMDDIVIQDLFI